MHLEFENDYSLNIYRHILVKSILKLPILDDVQNVYDLTSFIKDIVRSAVKGPTTK